jgi:hypothetical protein
MGHGRGLTGLVQEGQHLVFALVLFAFQTAHLRA